MEQVLERAEPEPLAIDVVPAGRMAKMNKQQSYRAARQGFMPTIRVSKGRMKVPLARWRAILNGEASAQP